MQEMLVLAEQCAFEMLPRVGGTKETPRLCWEFLWTVIVQFKAAILNVIDQGRAYFRDREPNVHVLFDILCKNCGCVIK